MAMNDFVLNPSVLTVQLMLESPQVMDRRHGAWDMCRIEQFSPKLFGLMVRALCDEDAGVRQIGASALDGGCGFMLVGEGGLIGPPAFRSALRREYPARIPAYVFRDAQAEVRQWGMRLLGSLGHMNYNGTPVVQAIRMASDPDMGVRRLASAVVRERTTPGFLKRVPDTLIRALRRLADTPGFGGSLNAVEGLVDHLFANHEALVSPRGDLLVGALAEVLKALITSGLGEDVTRRSQEMRSRLLPAEDQLPIPPSAQDSKPQRVLSLLRKVGLPVAGRRAQITGFEGGCLESLLELRLKGPGPLPRNLDMHDDFLPMRLASRAWGISRGRRDTERNRWTTEERARVMEWLRWGLPDASGVTMDAEDRAIARLAEPPRQLFRSLLVKDLPRHWRADDSAALEILALVPFLGVSEKVFLLGDANGVMKTALHLVISPEDIHEMGQSSDIPAPLVALNEGHIHKALNCLGIPESGQHQCLGGDHLDVTSRVALASVEGPILAVGVAIQLVLVHFGAESSEWLKISARLDEDTSPRGDVLRAFALLGLATLSDAGLGPHGHRWISEGRVPLRQVLPTLAESLKEERFASMWAPLASHEDEHISRAVLPALGSHGSVPYKTLAPLLDHPYPDLRRMAKGLLARATGCTLKERQRLLGCPDRDQQLATMDMLVRQPLVDPTALGDLRHAAEKNGWPEIAALAADALAPGSPEATLVVVEVLEKTADTHSHSRLIRRLKGRGHHKSRIGNAIAMVCQRFPSGATLRVALKVVLDEHHDKDLKSIIAKQYLSHDRGRFLHSLLETLIAADEDPSIVLDHLESVFVERIECCDPSMPSGRHVAAATARAARNAIPGAFKAIELCPAHADTLLTHLATLMSTDPDPGIRQILAEKLLGGGRYEQH